jgi:hypothetical protein
MDLGRQEQQGDEAPGDGPHRGDGSTGRQRPRRPAFGPNARPETHGRA